MSRVNAMVLSDDSESTDYDSDTGIVGSNFDGDTVRIPVEVTSKKISPVKSKRTKKRYSSSGKKATFVPFLVLIGLVFLLFLPQSQLMIGTQFKSSNQISLLMITSCLVAMVYYVYIHYTGVFMSS